MRGLIYKDIQIMKNNLGVLLAGFGMAGLLLVLTDADVSFIVSYFTFFSMMMALNTLGYDDMNHGMQSILSLPVTRSDYAKEKYVFTIAFGGGSWLLAVAIGAVYEIVRGEAVGSSYLFTSVMGALAMCSLAILMIPVQLYFGAEKARVAIFAVVMGIVLAGYGADYVLKSFDIEAVLMLDRLMELHPAAVLGIGAVGMAVFLLISMSISIMIVKKKEY